MTKVLKWEKGPIWKSDKGCSQTTNQIQWSKNNKQDYEIDESNNYGQAMTFQYNKCRRQNWPSFCCWYGLDEGKANEKPLKYNEFYIPLLEKEKRLYPSEISTFQPLETIKTKKRENVGVLSHKLTKEAYSAMMSKVLISLCLGHMRFLVKRAGWIHSNYT